MSDLYRSDNVVVRCVPAQDQSRWVVTFDNYGIGHGFDRPGFGEAFFKSAGVSAIHVLGRREDWYQYEEMPQAMAAVRAAVAGAVRVVTYGSSMGAYAAIRFADAAGADAVLAFSPQYSIDPAKAPFERRWLEDSLRIRWLDAVDGPIRCRVRPIVIYDPSLKDDDHAKMIAQDIPILAIPLRHAGHPTTSLVSEIGMLSPLVLGTIAGDMDIEAFARTAKTLRRDSSTYLATLAERQPPWRLQTALSLATRAHEASPHSLIALTALANLQVKAGDHAAAIALFARADTVPNNDNVHVLHHYANALVLAGRPAEAAPIARRAREAAPHMAHLNAWESSILWAADRPAEAVEAVERAMALAPQKAGYRKLRRKYLRKLPPGARTRSTLRQLMHWLTDRTPASPLVSSRS